MSLPSRIKDSDLSGMDFVKIDENKAKHTKFNSFRNRCKTCGDWVTQLTINECNVCRRKKMG